MKFLYKSIDSETQKLNSAHFKDGDREFYWSRKAPVQQLINHPVSNAQGYGDGYWRKAGKRDAEAIEQILIELGLLESRAQMNARVAKEAIGF